MNAKDFNFPHPLAGLDLLKFSAVEEVTLAGMSPGYRWSWLSSKIRLAKLGSNASGLASGKLNVLVGCGALGNCGGLPSVVYDSATRLILREISPAH